MEKSILQEQGAIVCYYLPMLNVNFFIIISAAIAIFFGLQENMVMFTIFKPLTTILIVIALLLQKDRMPGNAFITFFTALLACLVGDILLLDEQRFVAGLTAFLIGHLLLLRLFSLAQGWSWSLVPLFVLLPLGGIYFYYLYPKLGELAIPVALYSSVIIVMAWQGINLSRRSTASGSWLLAAGALLFMFSDSMIALNKFALPFEMSVLVILASYWLSLVFILYGVLAIERNRIKC